MSDFRESIRRRAGIGDRIARLFGGTKVFALVGKSGTGKSFRAKLVAEKYGIEHIVDDGLLIHGNSIVAGKSAKREQVYMSAVRTALFDDPLHRHEVTKAIRARKIRKILLIGTSDRMVARMAERLNLPPPFRVVFIEEVSTSEDIEKAQKSRNEDGTHVIPVPAIEVERDYPHLLSDTVKVLLKRRIGHRKGTRIYEKSVVQPTYDGESRGTVAISEHALGQMIAHCVDEFDSELTVKRVRIRPHRTAYRIRAEVEAPYGHSVGGNLRKLQSYVVDRIERFTGIMIEELDVVISDIAAPATKRKRVTEEHEKPQIQGGMVPESDPDNAS